LTIRGTKTMVCTTMAVEGTCFGKKCYRTPGVDQVEKTHTELHSTMLRDLWTKNDP
jgi:hypothetical protein